MTEEAYRRLSDKVLEALNLALEQEDLGIAEMLINALELALTRGAGGSEFVERRDFSHDIESALEKYDSLRKKVHSA